VDVDGLIRAIGGGIAGLVGNSIGFIGATLTAIYRTLEGLMPGGAAGLAVAAALLGLLSWNLLRR